MDGEVGAVEFVFGIEADADGGFQRALDDQAAAEGDDSLMEKYFEAGELSDEEILRGLRAGIINRSFAPVFVSAASAEIGIGPLLDAIVTLFPSPAEAAKAVPRLFWDLLLERQSSRRDEGGTLC